MQIDTAAKAADILAPFLAGAQGERVATLHLDASRKLIGVTVEADGGADEAELPVRAILAKALAQGAASILVAHNHPSGDPEPSAEDVQATMRLAEAARATGVRLLDHIVFGGGGWRSFRELGLL